MKRTVNEVLQEMNLNGLSDKASGNLKLNELTQLYESGADDIMELICNCFNYVYFKGMKAARRGK